MAAEHRSCSIQCPECGRDYSPEDITFQGPFPCPFCGTMVRVSLRYIRMVLLLSIVLGPLLLYLIGIRGVLFYVLLLPSAISVDFVLVVIARFLVPPTLQKDVDAGPLTRLGI